MKVRVKYERFVYGQKDYKAGDVVEVSDHEGQAYVEAGLVEEVKARKRSKK